MLYWILYPTLEAHLNNPFARKSRIANPTLEYVTGGGLGLGIEFQQQRKTLNWFRVLLWAILLAVTVGVIFTADWKGVTQSFKQKFSTRENSTASIQRMTSEWKDKQERSLLSIKLLCKENPCR
jgi:hypothetical protein